MSRLVLVLVLVLVDAGGFVLCLPSEGSAEAVRLTAMQEQCVCERVL